MKEIIFNEQQIELIKGFCLDILEESGGLEWSGTTKSVASQIIKKLTDDENI